VPKIGLYADNKRTHDDNEKYQEHHVPIGEPDFFVLLSLSQVEDFIREVVGESAITVTLTNSRRPTVFFQLRLPIWTWQTFLDRTQDRPSCQPNKIYRVRVIAVLTGSIKFYVPFIFFNFLQFVVLNYSALIYLLFLLFWNVFCIIEKERRILQYRVG